MYKLFLVDDEVELIDGVKTLIDWKSNDIELCGEADNGITALEKIIMLLPDIIIMDIKMPKMDGLELLHEISKHNLKVKCIILSGYDDFSYAQKAIELKAANYLLKPCRPSEILEAVLKAKTVIEEELSIEKLLRSYKLQLQENLPVLKEKLLRELINGTCKDYSKAINKMELYDIKLLNKEQLVSIIKIDSANSLYKTYCADDIEAIKIGISNMALHIFSNLTNCEIFQNDEDILIVYSIDSKYISIDQIVTLLKDLKEKVKTSFDISVTIGVGNTSHSIEELWKSFKEASAAVDSKFFLGDDKVILFDDICLSLVDSNTYPLNEELAIINCLRTGNRLLLKEKTAAFYGFIHKFGTPSKRYVQWASIALLGSFHKFCIEANVDISSISNDSLTLFESIQTCETSCEVEKKVLSILNEMFNKIEEKENKNLLIKSAIDYIKENYSKDISLEVIAKQIYITPGYLSQLFKQSTGVNFLEFLNKHRIQKAKELLKNKFIKNYEIAGLVGYSNEKYFSQMFKRYTGLTPTQYKESINSY